MEKDLERSGMRGKNKKDKEDQSKLKKIQNMYYLPLWVIHNLISGNLEDKDTKKEEKNDCYSLPDSSRG